MQDALSKSTNRTLLLNLKAQMAENGFEFNDSLPIGNRDCRFGGTAVETHRSSDSTQSNVDFWSPMYLGIGSGAEFVLLIDHVISAVEKQKSDSMSMNEQELVTGIIQSIYNMDTDLNVDLSCLAKDYRSSLQQRGIDLPFVLEYYRNDSLISKEGDNNDEELANMLPTFSIKRNKDGYSISNNQRKDLMMMQISRLTQTKNMEEGEERIDVVLKGADWYILQGLWGNLLLTILQKGFIVFAILYLVHIVLKQKEMSNIRSDFINNMTHEFKTPIATISAALEAMESFNAMDDKEKTKRYLGVSRGELGRLSGMIEKVLKISVWEKQGLELRYERFDLSELIFTVKETMKLKTQKEIIFDVKDVIHECIVYADLQQIQSVVNNLVDNAIKYSDERVLINVSLRILPNQKFELKISDNGWGIGEKHLKHIFEKFYRIPASNLYRVKGFGLGLSYVKKIVEEHRGEVKVTSKKNLGTCFTIRIPLHGKEV